MSSLKAARAVLVAVLVLLLGPGCAEDGADSSAEDHPSDTASPPSTPTSQQPDDAPAWSPLPGLGRCGPQPSRLAGDTYEPFTLHSQGRALPAVTIGQGRTVVVLLHQTDGSGLCGWLSFAARIAAVPGQRALAFDLCGYGAARCSPGSTDLDEQLRQVSAAIDEAMRRFHPRRLVLVGASMGGSLAVLTAARDPRPDAVVDLSGPDEWRGAIVHDRARDVRAPLLVAMSDGDGADEVAAARATVAAAGPGSRFVGARTGHGYVLLEDADGQPTSLSDQVLAWIAGR